MRPHGRFKYETMNTAKSTFNNLPPERQQEIIQVSIGEFLQNDYRNASLSNIIKKLKLAKGSFYRYFNSKKDLYLYLLSHVTAGRYEEIDKLIEALPENLEELLILNFRNKIEFDKANPLYSGFIYQLMRETGTPELGDITTAVKKQILSITMRILKKYEHSGKVHKNLDLDIAAWAIVQIQFSIYEYLHLQYNLNFIQNIKNGQAVFGGVEKETMLVVQQFAKILSNGISNTKQL